MSKVLQERKNITFACGYGARHYKLKLKKGYNYLKSEIENKLQLLLERDVISVFNKAFRRYSEHIHDIFRIYSWHTQNIFMAYSEHEVHLSIPDFNPE